MSVKSPAPFKILNDIRDILTLMTHVYVLKSLTPLLKRLTATKLFLMYPLFSFYLLTYLLF